MAIETEKVKTFRETDQKSLADLNERLKALDKAKQSELQNLHEESQHKQLEMVQFTENQLNTEYRSKVMVLENEKSDLRK